MDNVQKLQDQIAERLQKDNQKAKAEAEIKENQEKQKQAQKKKGDYPEILRGNLYKVIAVEQTGDYADDLRSFQDKLWKIITSIPPKFLSDYSIEDLVDFFRKM